MNRLRARGGPPEPPHIRSGPSWEPPTADELAELDSLGRAGRWVIGGLELKLTNLDKILFPAAEHGSLR